MKITVLGASGGVGKCLVEQATKRGHSVTAVARERSSVHVPEGVRVLRGELTSASFLREAVRGSEAVLSGLGLKLASIAPWASPEDPTFLDRSTSALVEAMRAEGARRVVVVSSGGVGDSASVLPAVFRVFVKTTALRKVFPALERMENALLQSGLDVCIARPTGLTDGPVTGRVVVPTALAGRATISRADVADWMLAQLEKEPFAHKTALLTETGAA